VIPLPDSFGEADVTSSGASVDMTRAPGHDRLEMLAHVPDLVDEHVSPDPRGDDRDWNPSLFAGGHVLRYGSWWATGGGQTYLAIPFRGRAWGCGIAFFEPLGGNSVRFFGITQRMPTGETCVVGATAAGSLFVPALCAFRPGCSPAPPLPPPRRRRISESSAAISASLPRFSVPHNPDRVAVVHS